MIRVLITVRIAWLLSPPTFRVVQVSFILGACLLLSSAGADTCTCETFPKLGISWLGVLAKRILPIRIYLSRISCFMNLAFSVREISFYCFVSVLARYLRTVLNLSSRLRCCPGPVQHFFRTECSRMSAQQPWASGYLDDHGSK